MPYVLVSGQKVADNWNDLTDGSLRHAIDRDERGQEVRNITLCGGGAVWSNTSAAGNVQSLNDCLGWNATSGSASTGDLNRADRRWSESDCGSKSCLSDLPFYCFEQ